MTQMADKEWIERLEGVEIDADSAKSESLESIEKPVKHAESFESALRDLSKLIDNTEVAAANISTYRTKKADKPREKHQLRKPPPHQQLSSPHSRRGHHHHSKIRHQTFALTHPSLGAALQALESHSLNLKVINLFPQHCGTPSP